MWPVSERSVSMAVLGTSKWSASPTKAVLIHSEMICEGVARVSA